MTCTQKHFHVLSDSNVRSVYQASGRDLICPSFPIKLALVEMGDGDSQPKRSVCAQCPGGVSFAAIETEYFLPSGLFVHEKFFFFFISILLLGISRLLKTPLSHIFLEKEELQLFRPGFVDLRYSQRSAGEK